MTASHCRAEDIRQFQDDRATAHARELDHQIRAACVENQRIIDNMPGVNPRFAHVATWQRPAGLYKLPEDEIATALAFSELPPNGRARVLRREHATPATGALALVFSIHFGGGGRVQAVQPTGGWAAKMKPEKQMKHNKKEMAAKCGNPEKTLRALHAWLGAIRQAWLQKNLRRLLLAEQENDGVVKLVLSEIRGKLERGRV